MRSSAAPALTACPGHCQQTGVQRLQGDPQQGGDSAAGAVHGQRVRPGREVTEFRQMGGTKLLSAFCTRRSTSTRPADHGGESAISVIGTALPLLGPGGTVVTQSAATVHPRRTEPAANVFNSDALDHTSSTDGDTAPRARCSWAALAVVLHGAPLPGVGAKCTHHRALDDRANHRMPRNAHQPRRLGLHSCAHPYLLSTPRNTPQGYPLIGCRVQATTALAADGRVRSRFSVVTMTWWGEPSTYYRA